MSGRERKGSDVIVVGGGAVGLACAWALAVGGRRVTVLERGARGGEATQAAGGMLSPLAESAGPGPFLDLGMASLALWPSFAERLEEETGVDLDLRLGGKLLLALDQEGAEALRARRDWAHRSGYDARWLEGAGLREREPAATPAALGGLHIAEDGQVDNRLLAHALSAAARAAGCTVVAAEAGGLLATSQGIRGVATRDGEEHLGDLVVLAAGAWSGGLSGLPRPLPVRPVKGQMIALAAPASLATALETEACYLIPRRGGSVWVGATSEEVGFSRGSTAEARAALRRAAAAAVPGLEHARELEAWDGFRPGTPDGLPFIGPDPDLSGLIHATGHFRNGILLTPITAELVARAAEGAPDPRLAAFRPDRFNAN